MFVLQTIAISFHFSAASSDDDRKMTVYFTRPPLWSRRTICSKTSAIGRNKFEIYTEYISWMISRQYTVLYITLRCTMRWKYYLIPNTYTPSRLPLVSARTTRLHNSLATLCTAHATVFLSSWRWVDKLLYYNLQSRNVYRIHSYTFLS